MLSHPPTPGLHAPRAAGITLADLLATLAIVAVLAALATPGFRAHLARAAVDSAASQMMSGLALARTTALTTGRPATLCLTDDESRCALGGSGWMLFTNDEQGTYFRRDTGETVLRREPLPRGVRVSGTRGHATYLPQPRAAATLTFTFCHDGAPHRRRSVVVSQTGRPRLVRAEDAAGRCS
jgi:type IV fimbrial biogenesis protein FimT